MEQSRLLMVHSREIDDAGEKGVGLDVFDRVLQADAPDTVSSFLQHMGRTGRREGQAANTTFFCESSESVLQTTALIEQAKQGWVEAVPVQDRCWPVLIHQLLTMALAGGGISQEDAWVHLSKVPDFAGISRTAFDLASSAGCWQTGGCGRPLGSW